MDNVTSGGYSLQIDPKNGVTYGITPDATTDTDSNKCVVGIQLPDWDEFIKCAVAASDMLEQYGILAFDFAHSKDKGWVMVESNNYAALSDIAVCPNALTYDKIKSMYN